MATFLKKCYITVHEFWIALFDDILALHRRRKVKNVGGAKLKNIGGGGGGQGGAKFPAGTWRRNDVDAT